MANKKKSTEHHGQVGFLERACLEAAGEVRGAGQKKAFVALGIAVGAGLRGSPRWMNDFSHAVNMAHSRHKKKGR